ncbi:MAG: SusC/RagA family TonB-linked outer membrane protein, partial [Bacteroidota bacterium]
MIQNYLDKGSSPGLKKWLELSVKLSFIVVILVASMGTTYAQSRTVSGKVTDSNGEGLIGVNVLIKGTLTGVATDVDGNYSIEANDGDVLVFSYIGFSTQEITVGAQAIIDILLEEDYGELDEVVVIGYGTTKKSDLTGSVAAIDTKDFNKGQINTTQQLLTGRVAGLSVTPGNGEPGGGATIRIRGGSSLSASNDPLFVVDGVPISLETIGGLRNPLSTINPQDIESVTVLKDASATAIYGARASNGVIIVTTKRGSKNQPLTIGYNSQFSISTLPAQLEVLNGDQYRELIGREFPEQVSQLGSANTNWQDEIFQDAFGTNQNITATGNIKGVPFRASIGYLNQEGTLRTGTYERSTVSLGIDPSLFNDQLKMNINVKGSFNTSDFANTGAIGAALDFDPTQPVRSDGPWGNYYFYPGTNADFPFAASDLAPENPVALLEQTSNTANVNRLIANVNFNYKLPFLEGLSANLNLATDRTTTDGLDVADSLAAYEFEVREGQALFGKRNKYDNKYENNLLEFYLNYQKDIPSINTN